MKKDKRLRRSLALVLCFGLLTMTFSSMVLAEELVQELELDSYSAVLMEQTTGLVIYEKNPHDSMPLASVTKVMTILLALEAVESGKVSLSDMITTSKRAMDQGGTQIFLEQGDQISLEDALIGATVGSANDAAVLIAEYIGGSYEGFIDLMNDRAKELGMTNTNFVNPTGLPVEGGSNMSSAYDIALMSKELLNHEKVYEWTTIQWDTEFLGQVYLSNTNMKFLRNYTGADGLKTGWTTEAGYCASATALRDETRFIAATMKASSSDMYLKDIFSLLNKGFGAYKTISINKKGDVIQSVKVDKGKALSTDIVVKENVSLLMDRKQQESVNHRINIPESVQAPLAKGQVVGNIEILSDNKVIKTVDLIVNEDIEKAGPFKLMGRMFKTMLQRVR